MKRKISNILLTSSALTTCVLAPVIISSCGTNWVEPIVMHDIYRNGEYVYQPDPSFQPLEVSDPMSQQTAIELYRGACEQDPELFQKDMLMATYTTTVPFIESSVNNLKDCTFGFSQPTFGTTTIWEWGFDTVEYNTISFTQKISMSFEQGSVETHQIIQQTVDITVSYKNVLFYVYEDLTSAEGGWHIGLMDETLELESLWPYSRNEKPWSINYDCSHRTKKTLYFQEDYDPIVINNCYYYTGVIDNVRELRSFYDSAKTEDTPYPLIDRVAANLALMLKYNSYYFKNIISLPDIGLTSQLHSRARTTATTISIAGMTKISSFKSPDTKELYVVSDKQLKFKEVNGQHELTLLGEQVGDEWHTPLRDVYGLTKDKCIFATIGPEAYTVEDTYTFNVPVSKFNIRMIFRDDSRPPIDTEVRLHYNTMILVVNDNMSD